MHIIKLCAAACKDVYGGDDGNTFGSFLCGGQTYLEVVKSHLWDGHIAWCLYKTRNPDRGTILAYMGTLHPEQVHQDMGIMYGGSTFRSLRAIAIDLDVPFKVIVAKNDPIAQAIGRAAGWQSSHIVKSSNIMRVHSEHISGHDMAAYCKAIGYIDDFVE